MSTEVIELKKPVVIDRKQNLREHRLYWVGRRTQDVVLSALALVVLSPVMLATAIAIVVDDPSAGPIFSQERIGRDGKPFRFYKFRPCAPMQRQNWTTCWIRTKWMVLCSRSRTTPALPVWVNLSARPASMSCPSSGISPQGRHEYCGPPPGTSPREVEQYGDYERSSVCM